MQTTHRFTYHFKVNNSQYAIEKPEKCIIEIRSWMVQHKLKINDDKTELIMISCPYNNNEINAMKIKIGEETVIASKNVKNLGVVCDAVFNMENRITSVCQSKRKQCVSIDDVQSEPTGLPYGVPQGSVLDPRKKTTVDTQKIRKMVQ